MVRDREAWHAAVLGSQRVRHDLTTEHYHHLWNTAHSQRPGVAFWKGNSVQVPCTLARLPASLLSPSPLPSNPAQPRQLASYLLLSPPDSLHTPHPSPLPIIFSLPQERNCRQLKIEQIKVQRWVHSRNYEGPSSSPQTSTPRQAAGSPLSLLLSLPSLPDSHPAGGEDVQTAGCWQGSGNPEGGSTRGLELPCRAYWPPP